MGGVERRCMRKGGEGRVYEGRGYERRCTREGM